MVVKTDSADRATTAAEATKGRLAGTRNALPAHEKRAVVAPSGKNTHTAPPARTSSVLRLPLQALVDEFLYEVDETLAAGTYRAYAVPLSLFVRYLRKSLAHEPLLADLTIETARSWSQMLRERPKQLRGGQAEGNSPISLASRRNYLRHLRAFANWLTKPPITIWTTRRYDTTGSRVARRRQRRWSSVMPSARCASHIRPSTAEQHGGIPTQPSHDACPCAG